jgi:hypothetical protein
MVVSVQIDNLTEIVNHETPVDLTLFCLQKEINQQDLTNKFIRNIGSFKKVKENPDSLFELLDKDNLSIFRHILCHLKVKGRKKTKARIWRKLFHYEQLFKYQNLN